MDDLLLTFVLTSAAGLFVACSTFVVTRAWLEPALLVRAAIADIALHLVLYADRYANPGRDDIREDWVEVAKKTRELAAVLHSRAWTVRGFRLARPLAGLPDRSRIEEASLLLAELSNGYGPSSRGRGRANAVNADRIRECLGLPKR